MKYLGFARITFNTNLASRIEPLINLASKPVFMIVSIFLWSVIYGRKVVIGGFTLDNTINYMMFSTIFSSFYGTMASNILGKRILRGNLIVDLIKPVDYGIKSVFITLGAKLYQVMFSVIPSLLIAFLFGFHIYSPLSAFLSFVAIFLGLLINLFLNLLWGLLYFKVKQFFPFENIKQTIFGFLVGAYIPLNFLPSIAQRIFSYLPFQFVVYVPSRIFISTYTLEQSLIYIGVQALWVIILYSLFKIGWHRALLKFEGVGA